MSPHQTTPAGSNEIRRHCTPPHHTTQHTSRHPDKNGVRPCVVLCHVVLSHLLFSLLVLCDVASSAAVQRCAEFVSRRLISAACRRWCGAAWCRVLLCYLVSCPLISSRLTPRSAPNRISCQMWHDVAQCHVISSSRMKRDTTAHITACRQHKTRDHTTPHRTAAWHETKRCGTAHAFHAACSVVLFYIMMVVLRCFASCHACVVAHIMLCGLVRCGMVCCRV